MIVVVIFGASGDLACKKTFPSLWTLYLNKKIERDDLKLIGYGRSELTIGELGKKMEPFIKNLENNKKEFDEFINTIEYIKGDYNCERSFIKLYEILREISCLKLLIYLALPPQIYTMVCKMIKKYIYDTLENSVFKHIIIEKPFGFDLDSSNSLSKDLTSMFKESDIYRIDHYLGKEMVQNILVFRFANQLFEPLFNKNNINCVLITFKEDFGTYGRGGYYDNSGIIRDIIQNHTMQVFSLISMDAPLSFKSNHIKDEKVKVLKNMEPFNIKNCVVGQYIGDKNFPASDIRSKGYKDDSSVPDDSITPTFITMVCYINNERWKGVPFIFKAGKALNERKGEIRIQFKKPQNDYFDSNRGLTSNELVIRLQPDEAIYCKFETKMPGLEFDLKTTELDLTFNKRYDNLQTYDAYEKLLLDVVKGSHINFVRSDELEESWKLFTPLLEELHKNKIKPEPYVYGTRGPEKADELIKKHGFVFDNKYQYKK